MARVNTNFVDDQGDKSLSPMYYQCWEGKMNMNREKFEIMTFITTEIRKVDLEDQLPNSFYTIRILEDWDICH